MAQAIPNILVVEDDRETRTLIAKYLRNNSCNVTTASDGREMARAMTDHRVDLLILDVMLPGEDQKIDAAVGHGADHLAAVGGGSDVAGVAAQVFCDQRSRLAIVLNDEDVGYCLGHTDLLSVIRAQVRRIFVSGCFWMTGGNTGQQVGRRATRSR